MSATIALSRPMLAESGRRVGLRLWPEWLTLALYASIVPFAIPFHEPWADEAQAWQLASHASLADLFTIHLRHEGHPGLWYVLLYALRHCGVTYAGLHWFTGLIATFSAALIIFRSPFPRAVRFALPFTFFLAFQYAVVARSYVLVPLLLFSLAAVWKGRDALTVALLLGLLANVCLHSTMLSFGLAILYFREIGDGVRKPNHRTAAILLLLVLFAFAVFTVLPQPKDLLLSAPLRDTSFTGNSILWALRFMLFLPLGLVLFPW